jgi:hypothetical protein
MDIHREQLDRAGDALGEKLALDRDGLEILLGNIVELINEADFAAIVEFLARIFDSSGIDELLERARALFSEVVEALSDLGKTIVAIIMDSIEYANNILSEIDYSMVVRVICHDISGALVGAASGATIGSIFPGIGSATGAVWGAIAAGAATSVNGFFDASRRV